MKFSVKAAAMGNGGARAGVLQLGSLPYPLETPALLLTTRKGLPLFIPPDLLPSLPSPHSRLLQFSPLHLYVSFLMQLSVFRVVLNFAHQVFALWPLPTYHGHVYFLCLLSQLRWYFSQDHFWYWRSPSTARSAPTHLSRPSKGFYHIPPRIWKYQ